MRIWYLARAAADWQETEACVVVADTEYEARTTAATQAVGDEDPSCWFSPSTACVAIGVPDWGCEPGLVIRDYRYV